MHVNPPPRMVFTMSSKVPQNAHTSMVGKPANQPIRTASKNGYDIKILKIIINNNFTNFIFCKNKISFRYL